MDPVHAVSVGSAILSDLPFIFSFGVFAVLAHRAFPFFCLTSATASIAIRGAFDLCLATAGVVAELVLCEISDWVAPGPRFIAWRVSTTFLLVMLIVVIPILLGYHWFSDSTGKTPASKPFHRRTWTNIIYVAGGSSRLLLFFTTLSFSIWLYLFYKLGDYLPISSHMDNSFSLSFNEGCIGRVGIIGISTMAVLSGFGAVSAPYSSFTAKPRDVSEMDLTRVKTGIETTEELIHFKETALRTLEQRIFEKQKTSSRSSTNLVAKMYSTFRGDNDEKEYASSRLELEGLYAMKKSLNSDFKELSRRYNDQKRARTLIGKVHQSLYFLFAIYCVYRIVATMVSRNPFRHRKSSFSQTDPITHVLALLAQYWDPDLNRQAWSRQIGFLFSGIIFMCSTSSVLSTVNMVSKHVPRTLERANLALLVAEILGTYVISTSLMLRSNLPQDMSSAVSSALGAPLDTNFVDRWFDALFLCTAGISAAGLYIGRRFFYEEILEDDILEGGKRA